MKLIFTILFATVFLFSDSLNNLLRALESAAKGGESYKEYKGLMTKVENEIYKIKDKEKKRKYTERLFVIEGEFIAPIEKKYKNFNLFFEGYCASSDFKGALEELSKANNYFDSKFKTKLFKNYSDWDGFDISLLTVNIQKIAKNLLEKSFNRWSKKRLVNACSQDDYKYINCSNEYKKFLTKYNSSFNSRTVQLNLISSKRMQEILNKIDKNTQEQITNFAKVMEDCKCMRHYKGVLKEYYPKKEANLISSLSKKIKKRCKDFCPFLWEITITQHASFNKNAKFICGDDDVPMRVDGTIKLSNVFLMPSCDKWNEISLKQQENCEKHLRNNIMLTYYNITNESGEVYNNGDLDYDFRASCGGYKEFYIWEQGPDCFGDRVVINKQISKKIDAHKASDLSREPGIKWYFTPINE